MPEDDPLAQKEAITPSDLQSLPLIVSWRIGEREVRAWFSGNTEGLNVFCTFDLLDNAALLVERRLGYALAIEGALKNMPRLAFRPLSPELSTTSVVVWKKHQPVSRAVQKFIGLVRNAYGA